MEVIAISVGRPVTLEFEGKSVTTSIFKQPVNGPVAIRELNVDGDEQADLSVHGGRDKAVYAYSRDYYETWAQELDKDLEPAQFGENLTISGGTDGHVVIGSRYCVGDAVLQVTQPRIPCYKLGIRFDDATFPNRFWVAGRLGFYLRVERAGHLDVGDAFELLDAPDHRLTVRDLHRSVTQGDASVARRALESLPHLDSGWSRRLRHAVEAG